MDYTIDDTFAVSAPGYWEMFFRDDFNEGLWKAVDANWELLEFEKTGEGSDLVIKRAARLTPNREIPKILKSFITSTLQYVERNDYSAAKSSMFTSIKPNFAADRVRNDGVYRVEPAGPDKCRRIWEGVCEVKVPLVGGKIEKFLVDSVRESFGRGTAYTNEWLASHKGELS